MQFVALEALKQIGIGKIPCFISAEGTAPLALRVGRQELFFGEQRLVGHLAWVNDARTWDAMRVTVRRRGLTVDAFAASLVRSLDGFDRSGNGNRFAGAYATASALIPRASVEPSACLIISV